ncbi:RDD family protein [Acidipila rosea]|uniref:Putative RDD family membrane protein YckC n=1 Tax=Acidipila rosea TaxID=768535 RepID=A0A4R1L4D7_9BACT|nr:RDD family protein [Acidipila rosea]TCK71967.1 putative RDD family membrane protein YckC [Acidipila rosea]
MNTATSSLPVEETTATPGHRLPSWKDELNARLAAHRNRRDVVQGEQPNLPGMENTGARQPRANRPQSVAARVAERYSKAPSYEEMLAAARAAEAAAAAAEQARAAAQVILAGMDHAAEEQEPAHDITAYTEQSGAAVAEAPTQSYSASYHQPLPQRREDAATPNRGQRVSELSSTDPDPFGEALIAPPQPLPAKLIEFPRELIASRKARPRRDEGPLLEDASQLRIFEVEAGESAPVNASQHALPESAAPDWHSIRLDARTEESGNAEKVRVSTPATAFDLPLKTAPLADRLMAGIVDVALVLFAFLLFVLIFAACTTHPPVGKPALFGAGAALAGLFVLYQWLFFTYAEATPGMRYAKIALCTFDDENPCKRALHHRMAALLLAALPLGLGFVWSFFDEDRLSWHDRMTRTYQRSYR